MRDGVRVGIDMMTTTAATTNAFAIRFVCCFCLVYNGDRRKCCRISESNNNQERDASFMYAQIERILHATITE